EFVILELVICKIWGRELTRMARIESQGPVPRGLSLHCCGPRCFSLGHAAESPDFGLVFACEVLHHVVYGIVLQERVSLCPGLIAANGSHQRRSTVRQRVTEIPGHGNGV